MLIGTVTADLQPVLVLPVAGQMWPAHVDTGFNGDLELPEALRSLLNPRYLCRSLSELAAGQTILEDLYEVTQFSMNSGAFARS